MAKRTLIDQTSQLAGKSVVLRGWVDSKRDHGKLTFIDLRDRSGVVQCVGANGLGKVTPESVLEIVGQVKARPEKMINPNLKTGQVEVEVKSFEVLNKSRELPIPVSGDGKEIAEEIRLEYRYLDLRRERLQQNIKLRSKLANAFRQALLKREFNEIETPMLTKSTKEGARDFIVPSRFQPGKFYALPQSPQQYKQLLMTAGFEQYFQLARCIRDEDLRADRGFEHTQVDIEMSFVDRDEIMAVLEGVAKEVLSQFDVKLKDEKFPVVTYQEAMKKYGEDRFDLRTEAEKKAGVLAFAWVVDFPFFKKVDKADAAEVRDGKSGWTFTHNPFSMPKPEHLADHLAKNNLDQILTTQYDLVCNGYEVGGGSIRAHDPAVLRSTFEIMGYSAEQIEASVGHMLKAFEVGTPPHGGVAFGLDRWAMLLSGESSLKEVIAFPMSSTGRTAVMTAPSQVEAGQLQELGIRVEAQSGLSVHDKILAKLQAAGVNYQYHVHPPVYTSEEAAKIRGTKLNQAAKALVVQIDKEYAVFVVPGDQRADLDALAKKTKAKKVRMASKESVLSKTGIEVGAIPPFGSTMEIKTYLDSRLTKVKEISFNIGLHDRSATIATEDYLRVEQPTLI